MDMDGKAVSRIVNFQNKIKKYLLQLLFVSFGKIIIWVWYVHAFRSCYANYLILQYITSITASKLACFVLKVFVFVCVIQANN